MIAKSTTIVIVEQQPLMLAALSTTLAAEGMKILAEVSDSREALRAVGKLHPQLALFSVAKPSLPDLERISVLRHEFPNVLVLALVDGEYRGQERAALDFGAHRAIATAPRGELLSVIKELSTQFISSLPREAVLGH